MPADAREPFEADVGAASVLFTGFVALFLLIWLLAPPTLASSWQPTHSSS